MHGRLLCALALLLIATLLHRASAQAWMPTEEQNKTILTLTHEYFAAKDNGDYKRAYGFKSAPLKQMLSLAEFSRNSERFNKLAGAVMERRLLELSWSKDPPQAPLPGIYAVVDFVSRFENIDRHCGYLVFHQEPNGEFLIAREEENFMDRDTERRIKEEPSQQEVERKWAELAAFCP